MEDEETGASLFPFLLVWQMYIGLISKLNHCELLLWKEIKVCYTLGMYYHIFLAHYPFNAWLKFLQDIQANIFFVLFYIYEFLLRNERIPCPVVLLIQWKLSNSAFISSLI